jgi:hypothetical protein
MRWLKLLLRLYVAHWSNVLLVCELLLNVLFMWHGKPAPGLHSELSIAQDPSLRWTTPRTLRK